MKGRNEALSWAHYLSVVVIMAAVFALCMGVGPERAGSGEANREKPAARPAAERETSAAVYLGDGASARARAAAQWAAYARVALEYAASPEALPEGNPPGLALVEPAAAAAYARTLQDWVEAGTDVICLGLPGADELARDETLRALLGVREIRAGRVPLKGIRVFPGFLLGGERLYEADGEASGALPTDAPWFVVRENTTTYIRGLPEEDARNEDLPALVWRCSRGRGALYAVFDGFADNPLTGMGMLAAIAAQRQSCALYPVVNARLLSLVHFPAATDGDDAAARRAYAASPAALQRETILPMCRAATERHGLRMTCFTALFPGGGALPDGELTALRQEIDGMGGEVGLAWPGDAERLRPGALWLGDAARPASWPEGVRTAVVSRDDGRPVVSRSDDDVTLQQAVHPAATHAFSDDLELLGLETALGYAHAWLDMAPVLRPDSAADEWQNVSRAMFAGLATAGAPFDAFDDVTASEADARIRRFLALGWTYVRTGRHIALDIDGFDTEAFFVLRTHGERVAAVSGGTGRQIEEDAYLIRAMEPHVDIALYDALRARLGLEDEQ